MDIPTMWTKCVSLATLLPMLLHSILGCCWHHAHSSICETMSCEVSTERVSGCLHHSDANSETAHPHPLADCAPNSSSPADHGETPLKPCDEVRCVYVGAATVQLPKDNSPFCFNFTAEAHPSLVSLSLMTVHGSQRLSDNSLPTSQSLRARAQVWLI